MLELNFEKADGLGKIFAKKCRLVKLSDESDLGIGYVSGWPVGSKETFSSEMEKKSLYNETLGVNVAISRKKSRVSKQFSVLIWKMIGNGNERKSWYPRLCTSPVDL